MAATTHMLRNAAAALFGSALIACGHPKPLSGAEVHKAVELLRGQIAGDLDHCARWEATTVTDEEQGDRQALYEDARKAKGACEASVQAISAVTVPRELYTSRAEFAQSIEDFRLAFAAKSDVYEKMASIANGASRPSDVAAAHDEQSEYEGYISSAVTSFKAGEAKASNAAKPN